MTDDHRSIVRRGRSGGRLPKPTSRPVASPIWPSVVYASPDADALDAQYEGRAAGYTYGREGHPNWTMLAEKHSSITATWVRISTATDGHFD